MKPKVIIDREPVSSSEILQRKNFSKLSADAKLMQKPFYQSNWFISSIAIASVAIVSAILIINSNEKANENISTPTTTEQQTNSENKTISYNEDSPCIHPPIKGAEKPFSSYFIDAEKGGSFTHPTGSKIEIPAKVLTDENGNLVSGKVEIKYREFHDQTDILLSGIPMQYDSAGYKYQFESAGMVDIYAVQNGNKISLKEGETIKIELASRVAGTQFNLYELDTASRNWVYKGKDLVTQNQKTGNNSVITEKENTTLTQADLLNMKKDPEIKQLEKELSVIKNELAKIKSQEPIQPKAVDVSKYNFNIDVDPKEFPEFAAFNETRFEVGTENKGFNAEMYSKVWDDALLAENKKGISYKLTLVKGTDKKTFIVYPVFQGASLEHAKKIYEEKFNSYQEKYSDKKEEEQKKQTELLEREERWKKEALKIKEKNQLELAKQNKVEVQNNNQVISNSNLNEYGLVLINGQVQNVNGVTFTSNQSVVTRTFSADGFGTFNCDSPQKWPSGADVQANFTNVQDGKRIQADLAYLVIADKNLYYPYASNTWFNFRYNPKSNNAIVIPMRDGHVAYITATEFKKVDSDNTFAEFKMKVSENSIKSEGEFRAFLMEN